jgi:hypothetical protein
MRMGSEAWTAEAASSSTEFSLEKRIWRVEKYKKNFGKANSRSDRKRNELIPPLIPARLLHE